MEINAGFRDIYQARIGQVLAFIQNNRWVGPAQEIEPAYHALLGTWLPDSGYQPDDRPCYELYHATPETNPEGNFVMDICIPVVPL